MNEAREASFDDREPAEREAVARTQHWLESLPEHARLETVEADREHRVKGIDFYWHRKDGTRVALDVKGDTQAHEWRNYIIELLSVQELGRPGNFVTSQAELWHYHILEANQIHIWDLRRLREWFYQETRVLKTFRTRTRKEGGKYHTWGLRLPIDEVLRAPFPLVEVVQLPW